MVPSLESALSQPSSGVISPPQKMPPRSRTQSISSDRPSTIAHSFMSPPLSVSPEAAFIAGSAASQIVTNDHDSHADAWYDQHGVEPSGETAVVSPAALQLVNNFLDQLLFNFLSIARSTSISALRPAVSEVLKPKLAKDAINQADEELREYLGGDDEDLAQAQSPVPSSPRDWDLELAWKRTRLRCMVYSSLGDMEEEDEDFYMEQEHLDAGIEDRLSEVVSPAVAIFLTSILEFMGEQALVVAGQASYHRMRAKYEKELKDGARSPADPADRVLVEELDMERVALDRTLGRLWRAWKKKIRSPGITTMEQRLTRSYSRDSMRGTSGHLRSPSSITGEPSVPTVPEPVIEVEAGIDEDETIHEPLEEYLAAAAIPLPIGPRDVDEIEVPGLVYYSDDEAEADEDEEELMPVRPKSLMILPVTGADNLPTPTTSRPQTALGPFRKRSNSLPTPATTPYSSPPPSQLLDDDSEVLAESPRDSDDMGSPGITEIIPKHPIGHPIGFKSSFSPDSTEAPWSEEEDEATPMPASLARDLADTDIEEGEEEEEEEFVVIEEPQILMSSRVSISGRSSSPAASAASDRVKPTAINTNLPVRTPSIHSARLIDVASPRSPAVGSRRSSVDAADHVRQANQSRMSGGRTPPVIEERMRRSPDSMSAFRSPAIKSGLSGNQSISEAEEIAGIDDTASTTSPASTASAGIGAGITPLAPIPEPASAERYGETQPIVPGSRSVFGSVAQRAPVAPTPPSPVKPVTKVTIISSTASTGNFIAPEEKPEPPRKVQTQTRPQPTTPTSGSFSAAAPPTVPERSAVRQGYVTSSPPRAQPSTIGQVSVERTRTRSPSEPAPSRSQESSGVVSRQQHTSGSNSSTSTTRLKVVRTSEETTRSRIDVARNFEELIQSDQTIQYTLTPESMRDIDSQSNWSAVTGSPVIPVKTRKSEDARQTGDRSRSSSVAQSSEIKRSISVSRSTGPSSYSPAEEKSKNSLGNIQSGQSAAAGRSAPSAAPKSRTAVPQARDARLPRESLAEFADFIRSTGPAGASVTSAAVRNPPAVAGSIAKTSVDSSRVTTGSVARARLQARDAAVDYKDDKSDLIDFIRRGPPSAAGNPRIPRTVAPFRTTMDSDQLSGAVGGRAVDAQLRDVEVRSSQASTHVTDASVRSVPSSINSQSALLGRNKPLPGGNNRFGGAGDDDDMPIPKRKTRRVRDPYAIDLSDEDDDGEEDESAGRPQRRAPPQEESLLDFLKSMPPPPEPVVQPFSNAQTQVRPKKKSSAPSLMARFTRRDSTRNGGDSSGSSSPRSPVPPVMAAEPRNTASRASTGKGYIPIQVNIPPGADRYAPTTTNFSKPVKAIGGAAPAGSGRVQMKKFEPREAVSVPSRGTSELAEFFKNSEPPAGIASGGMGRDDDGYSKTYAKRKKTTVA